MKQEISVDPRFRTLGQKHDGEKERFDLIPTRALRAFVKVLTFGARKYAPGGWAHVPDARRRYYAAALRHLTAWWEGERLDPETSLPHLAHALCCVAFLLGEEEGDGAAIRNADAPDFLKAGARRP